MEEVEISLSLPKIPKDCYYEDYIAAILNAGGYYLQRSIHHNINGIEMLELDAVATKIEKDKVRNTVIEIKSGGWGIRDIFKVFGWLNYLSIENATGAFIFQNEEHEFEFKAIQEVANKMGIALIQNKRKTEYALDDGPLKDVFGINTDRIPESVIKTFRYSFNLERVMLNYIHSYTQKYPQFQTPRKVYRYLRDLNDISFTHRDPIDRLNFLSAISAEHSYLAGILYNEISGNGLYTADDKPNFREDYCNICFPKKEEISPVYVALHTSLLNKLHVLKGIVEYISTPDNNKPDKFDILLESLKFNSLNTNIQAAISELKTREHYYLYPYFWQVFIYVFGCFILLDKKDEEYLLLSKITGVPVEKVEETILFWDILFPTSRGWFSNPLNAHSNIMYLKMAPAPLCGIGVNFRLHYYATNITPNADYFENLKKQLSGKFTFSDLVGWNNVAYSMLKLDTALHVSNGSKQDKVDERLVEIETHINSCGRYVKATSIKEYLKQPKKDTAHKGFIAYYNDDTYDLYIVKNNNAFNNGLGIYNIAKEIGLNVGNLKNGLILGTEQRATISNNDNIWFSSTFKKADISELDGIIEVANNKRA